MLQKQTFYPSNRSPLNYHPTPAQPRSSSSIHFGKQASPQPPLPFPTQTLTLSNGKSVLRGTTGGTIDMVKSGDGPRTPNRQTGKVLAGLDSSDQPSFCLFDEPSDSSNINRHLQRELVAKVVDKHRQYPDAAFVITHGTDTLMEDAALLSYQKLPVPIVMTGSWSSPGEAGNDANSNVRRAEKLASRLSVPGVFVTIGDYIHLGTRLNKVRSHPVWLNEANKIPDTSKPSHSYFISLNQRPFGFFDKQDQPHVDAKAFSEWKKILEKRGKPLPLKSPLQPVYVEHQLLNQAFSLHQFQQMIKRLQNGPKPCGAILEGAFSQHPDANRMTMQIESLWKKGIHILTTDPAPAMNGHFFNISDIPPIHLRAKLAAILSNKEAIPHLAEQLRENVAGEVLGQKAARQSWHSVAPLKQADVVVVANPSLQAQEIRDAVKGISDAKANPTSDGAAGKLFLIGTGDGHIDIGTATMKERISKNHRPSEKVVWERLIQALETEGSPKGLEPNYSVESVFRHLARQLQDSNQAKSLLREKLCQSHENLAAIGDAIKQGIEVRIGTKLPFARANLKSYEIGTILGFIGAKAL